MMPATKPTMMIQIMPPMLMSCSPSPECAITASSTHSRPDTSLSVGSRPSGVRWSITCGRYWLRPFSSSSRDRPLCEASEFDLVGAERAGEIARRNRLVRALADPGIGGVAMAALLQLLEQVAEPARDHAAGRGAAEQAAQRPFSTSPRPPPSPPPGPPPRALPRLPPAHRPRRRRVRGRRRHCAGLVCR